MKEDNLFISNYLSRVRFKGGKVFAAFFILVCYFMSQIYWNYPIGELLYASKENVFESREWWRLLSSTFIHGDLGHLLANSLMLFILALVTVSFYGHLFTATFIGFTGIATNYLTLMSHSKNLSLVGASGVLFSLWGFWLIMYFFIERQKSFMGRVLRIGAVFLVLLVPSSYDPQTSYRAHYIGFFIGVVLGSLYFLIKQDYLRSFELWEPKPVEVDDGSIPWRLDQSDSEYMEQEGFASSFYPEDKERNRE